MNKIVIDENSRSRLRETCRHRRSYATRAARRSGTTCLWDCLVTCSLPALTNLPSLPKNWSDACKSQAACP